METELIAILAASISAIAVIFGFMKIARDAEKNERSEFDRKKNK